MSVARKTAWGTKVEVSRAAHFDYVLGGAFIRHKHDFSGIIISSEGNPITIINDKKFKIFYRNFHRPVGDKLNIKLPIYSFINHLRSGILERKTLFKDFLSAGNVLCVYCSVPYCAVLYCSVLYCVLCRTCSQNFL